MDDCIKNKILKRLNIYKYNYVNVICDLKIMSNLYRIKSLNSGKNELFIDIEVTNKYESVIIPVRYHDLLRTPMRMMFTRLVPKKSSGGYIGYGKYTNNTCILKLEDDTQLCIDSSNPIYSSWDKMLIRCLHNDHECYFNTNVSDIFKSFQHFCEWTLDDLSVSNYRLGYSIDKDLFNDTDNRCYSPQTCVFLPSSLNNLIKDKFKNTFIVHHNYSSITICGVNIFYKVANNKVNDLHMTIRYYKYKYIIKYYKQYELINNRVYNKLLDIQEYFKPKNGLVFIKKKTIDLIKDTIKQQAMEDNIKYKRIIHIIFE